ncbi:MAG: tRNA (adenosine(37)-N6)-dimethylallyltransferase MiaA [Arcicella sp.]|jgi:tRNA dimethylallyltransferase|nr:tRNA (adenosine(37)-N6)-dimethylallyltransferase MiaA [Arcicella sp.]
MKTFKDLIVILGPTASGKTHLAVQLAHRINGEIISADSRQVYRGMDIGTGKDLEEYTIDNQSIPYHLIDILNAGEQYHIHLFQQDFLRVYNDIIARGKTPILCGGSGMYIEAVLQGYEFTAIPIDENYRETLLPKSYEELLSSANNIIHKEGFKPDLSTKKRLIRAFEISRFLHQNPDFEIPKPTVPQSIIFGLNPDTEIRREKITKRLHHRLENGMIEEVKTLIDNGISPEKLIFYGLEYKFITQYLTGELTYEIMVERLNVAIHQFAKRQMTYFRKMERDGLEINWLSSQKPLEELIERLQIY